MIRALRAVGSVALWAAAIVGILCGLVWGATQAGLIKPLVVISGSMEPGIMTGDLVVDRPHATADAEVGQVASIRSTTTGKVVSHRIVEIEQADAGTWHVRMKGDANDSEDSETYVVGATIWQPAVRVPGVGHVVSTVSKRSFTVPLGIALLSCVALTLLPLDDEDVEGGDPGIDGIEDGAAEEAEESGAHSGRPRHAKAGVG